MSAPQHNDKIEGAPVVAGAEHGEDEIDSKREPVLLKSSHDKLEYWKTVRLFWKVCHPTTHPLFFMYKARVYQ